jgi:hypothetical protein
LLEETQCNAAEVHNGRGAIVRQKSLKPMASIDRTDCDDHKLKELLTKSVNQLPQKNVCQDWLERSSYQQWKRCWQSCLKWFSFRVILRSVYRFLLFVVSSGTVIDKKTEHSQFPEYIQILAKDGIDLHKVKAKVSLASK